MKVLYFDTETTGLNPSKNAIIQFAAIIEVDGKCLDEIEIKMQPHDGALIDKAALEIHGYSEEDFKDFVTSEEAYKRIIAFIDQYVDKFDKSDKMYVAGQNVEFDVRFLQSFFKAHGNSYYGSYFNYRKIDLLSIMTFLQYNGMFNDMKNLKLETIYREFFNKDFDAHDAIEDIEATWACINECKKLIKKGK